MQNEGSDAIDIVIGEKQGVMENLPREKGGVGQSSLGECAEIGAQTVLTIVISSRDSVDQVPPAAETKGNVSSNAESRSCNPVSVISEPKGNFLKTTGTNKDEIADAVAPKKGSLSRSESSREQCRVCQQQTEEALIDLGCRCRGGLAKAHRSCIDTWFRTRGSNKCEICQQVAANVAPPESLPSTNYWVWRIDPTFRGGVQERERGCFSPLWVAFSILIGGLLLDVLISISLGVSALPVNIIIGVLVVLGLGTALRLALECCHEWSIRRVVQRVDTNITIGYHPAV